MRRLGGALSARESPRWARRIVRVVPGAAARARQAPSGDPDRAALRVPRKSQDPPRRIARLRARFMRGVRHRSFRNILSRGSGRARLHASRLSPLAWIRNLILQGAPCHAVIAWCLFPLKNEVSNILAPGLNCTREDRFLHAQNDLSRHGLTCTHTDNPKFFFRLNLP